ncbi:serine hydrolase domain-containing protein [Cohnella herbarum]|uniref:Beta-lactamase family protein n=1 Tax=Cohnella herbarum TaxID=2728023 RepID=A0A7Z2ZK99_9BACL|nr:serine hydrolase domain-containing protein [Cohnella herbarum]QJD82748.1 beta-lactamase family protein [Cohnella herbarum]
MNHSRFSRIQTFIEQRIQDRKLAGAASLVARNGRIVHCKVQGFADVETGKLLERDAIFRLASMTKPIIGVAAMMLVEEGKIKLSDPLGKFIPEFDRGITIHHLLTHSCGLGQGPIGFQEMLMPGLGDTLAIHIPKWAKVPLDFQPGSQTGYSPIAAFDILGRVIEITSGIPLDQYLHQFLFQPLGMKDTTFVPTDKQWQRVVTMYEGTDQGLVKFKDQKIFFHPRYFSGAAGLFGTLDDYCRFAQMLANGGELGGYRILSEMSVRIMGTAQLADTIEGFPRGQAWGLSMRVITDRAAAGTSLSNGSFGWSGAWGTHFWVDPKENLVALLMINLANAGGADAETAREFEGAVMRSLN